MSSKQMEDWEHGGFGLYIHWPFCLSKCPYCDFNSHVAAKIDQNRWKNAYLKEIARVGKEMPGRILKTVYFGGGTPSLMDPALVNDMIEKIKATWPMANDPEVTLEANPTSVEAGLLNAFRDAGVTRVSLGLQALNDADLRRLGRAHSVDDALRAYDVARRAFGRVSFDLIYARQDQGLADWKAELSLAVSLAVDHLSLYQLTIEDGTVFAARHKVGHLRGLPTEDLAADMFELTQDVCGRAGLPAYEVSNHARPGAESQHNLIYWRGGDYIGIGPGAHGRVTLGGRRWATEAPRSPDGWLSMIESTGAGENPRLVLSDEDRALEYLLMGLRLSEGIDVARYDAMSPKPLDREVIADLIGHSLVHQGNGRISATLKGRAVLNGIIRELALA